MRSSSYSDGDIIIIVENNTFQLHKNILSLASVVFRDMLDCVLSREREEIPRLEVEHENSYDFKNLLAFIYPGKYGSITWNNIEGLFRISDKFIVESATVACEIFLTKHYRENPMLTFKLADIFNLNHLYKESSKLILNNYQNFKSDPTFEEFSDRARAALNERYIKFFFGLCSIVKGTIMDDYVHKCKNSKHFDTLEIEWENRIEDLTIPPPSPSAVYEKIFVQIEGNYNRRYNENFTNKYLPMKIDELMGEFEPLDSDSRYQNFYIYVERR